MQVLLQAFDLLLFGLQAGLHFHGPMSQHLLGLLQIFYFELLLEKLILLLFQIQSRIFFVLIQLLNLLFIIFALFFKFFRNVSDRVSFSLQLFNLCSDLVFVVTFPLNIVLEFRNLFIVAINHICLLSRQLGDLMKLVLFLGSELFFIFHLKIISHLLAVLVHPLHVLESDCEVV